MLESGTLKKIEEIDAEPKALEHCEAAAFPHVPDSYC
jgi:hypothetical protein